MASNHELAVYGGIQHPDKLLEHLAEAIRKNQLPMVINHDHARTLDAHCLNAEVVTLDDGHRAVDAEFDVDKVAWDAFQDELRVKGIKGGMSFTYGITFAEFAPRRRRHGQGKFQIVADASYFTKADLEEVGEELAKTGTVRLGLLYQFALGPTCRIIVEYAQTTGGIQSAIETMGLGVASNGIYQVIAALLCKLKTKDKAPDSPPQIEIHTKTSPDGSTERRFLLRTDSEEVLKHALDQFTEGLERPEQILVWNETERGWSSPEMTLSAPEDS